MSRRRALAVVALGSRRFWAQNMPHHAAALTYYSVLALFQGMLIALGLLGLLGDAGTLGELTRFLERLGADERLVETLVAAGRDAVERRGASAVTLVVAVVIALFVMTSAWIAATTALNVVVEAEDPRSFKAKWLDGLGKTVVATVLGVAAVTAVFLGGDFASALFATIGLDDTARTVWSVVRLPLAVALATTAFAWTYYAAPVVPDARWRWISLGAVTAVGVWLVASLGLFAFAAASGTFDTSYGSFGTAVLLLVWLWFTNAALLLGAEVNAAGRYAEGMPEPLSKTGDTPEDAQHHAAQRRE
jgi:membrane protein